MTQKPSAKAQIAKAGNDVVKALADLVLLLLMLGAAGGAGYWFGTTQRMAPIQMVGPGTPGAMPAPNAVTPTKAETKSEASHEERSDDVQVASAPKKHGKKYWVESSGSDYIGYSIKVNVNDQDVDNFFAPGKAVDVTRLLKAGQNSITFNAQVLDEKFNAHKGDASKKLVVKLITGPAVQEDYKPSDVVLTYQRNAGQSESDTQTFTFNKSN
ncbi:MAG TPA: hypothetical protein V6C76_17940 [Drouetiella sp.]